MNLASTLRRALHSLDAALCTTGRYFLQMAGACAAGIGLLYLGLFLGNRTVIAIAVLLQIPFWVWALPFVSYMFVLYAMVIPVFFYVYFVSPGKAPNSASPGESR